MTTTDTLKTMISGLTGKTVYSQLEPLMPEIDLKIKEGVPRNQIHALIQNQGIEISAGTFYNYLHRYRKRNKTAKPTVGNKQKPADKQNGNSEQQAKLETNIELEQVTNPSSEELASTPTNMLDAKARDSFTETFAQKKRPIFGNKGTKQ